MPLETVRVTINSNELPPQLVDGVTVLVYDATGTTLQTSAVTGAVTPGVVEFSLNGEAVPESYQLRFGITGGAIVSPQTIEVYSPPAGSPTGTNNFLVTADLFVLPPATEQRLCRASGFVKQANGRARPGIEMQFIPCFNPLVVDGESVLGERVTVRTDVDGYVEVELYRFGQYDVTIESHENLQRQVVVPDRSAVNINTLLFPVVASATFNPAGPFEVAVGAELEVTPTVTASNFQVLEGTASDDVLYSTADPDIASVATRDGTTLVIRGLAVGVTTLELVRADGSIVYIPDAGINGSSAQITVT
jgi:hypothetical protein